MDTPLAPGDGHISPSPGSMLPWRFPVNTFIVDLTNRPGELARVTEAIAAKGIDITAFSGSTCGQSGSLALVTDDDAATQRALGDGQWKFHTIELVEASLADRPGSLADVARRLATAGVNVEA